ncbi:MAG: hypothetical protein IIY01_03155, partial [Clostridia bacterium]|nr:hypothetical protein [Clostridia bacterium]
GEVVPYTVMSLLMALLIFWAHRENIKRLRSGTEPSLCAIVKSFLSLFPKGRENAREIRGSHLALFWEN